MQYFLPPSKERPFGNSSHDFHRPSERLEATVLTTQPNNKKAPDDAFFKGCRRSDYLATTRTISRHLLE